ncbi:432_t:CDS:2 [Funneliformis mosseae]|uniref:432_t:CDS:1 n=1 Tax=Funneliformis mosseae TaxID=27381 RepID=A0A9N8W7A6_FUNMO|nr:432_t:CDS:2 [Funneliformis mosseae]
MVDNDFIRSAKRALSALLESARGEPGSKYKSEESEETSEPGAKQLKLSQNEDFSTSPKEKMIVHYHEGLSNAHASTCPWRERHCDDFIYKISLALDQSILKGFLTRASPLIQLGDKLPVIKVEINEEFTQTINAVMPSEAKTVDQDILIAAACLSLFGWEYELIDGLDMLKCPFCFRQCPLINYRNIAKHREIQQKRDKGILQDNQKDEENTQDMEILDLKFDTELEHRWYCAWITGDGKPNVNKTSEELTKKKPGWHITLDGIVRSSIPFNPNTSVDLTDLRLSELRNNLSPSKKMM